MQKQRKSTFRVRWMKQVERGRGARKNESMTQGEKADALTTDSSLAPGFGPSRNTPVLT